MAEPTKFAPAERATPEQIEESHARIVVAKYLQPFIDAVPNIMMILNRQRQIVFFNTELLHTYGFENGDWIYGLRTGELFSCVNSTECEGGCGTSDACRFCGSILSILSSQQGEISTRDCRMLVRKEGHVSAVDLRVTASPTEVDGEAFTIFTIVDVSDAKRRSQLERIFFHDVLNTANALHGLAQLGAQLTISEEAHEIVSRLPSLTRKLMDEIEAQRQLMYAELGELTVQPEWVSTNSMWDELIYRCSGYPMTRGKTILLDTDSNDSAIEADPKILSRVLVNMLKNALEASSEGDTVTVRTDRQKDQVIFSVYNRQAIPKELQLQLFHRSFSTKGNGRGVGTYSMLLLTERYLRGTISFQSEETGGTTFFLKIPAQYSNRPQSETKVEEVPWNEKSES